MKNNSSDTTLNDPNQKPSECKLKKNGKGREIAKHSGSKKQKTNGPKELFEVAEFY